MNVPISFRSFFHIQPYENLTHKAISASLYTVRTYGEISRGWSLWGTLGYLCIFRPWPVSSLYKENTLALILLKVIILCWQLMVTQTQRDPWVSFHCIHEECENNSFRKRITDEEEPQKWKNQGVVWIQFCCVLL